MNEQQSENLLLKVDPLSTIRNHELIEQGEELETSAKLRPYLTNISLPRSERAKPRAMHSKPNENCADHRKHGVTLAINCSESE